MTTFNAVVLVIALTGAVMVVGGIWLIASGAVKLNAQKGGATNVRIGDLLTLSTTVPGLGLFVIGLAFQAIAMIYANSQRVDDSQAQAAVQSDRQAHAVHLVGYFASKDPNEQITLSACIGGSTVVPVNTSFEAAIDLYSNFLFVKAVRTAADPLQWTITRGLPAPYHAYENTIFLKDGNADVGRVVLPQPKIQLADIDRRQVAPPTLTDAGSAYSAGVAH